MSDQNDIRKATAHFPIARVSDDATAQDFFSIAELANRWRCSRGTVYNRLRAVGAGVLDFAAPGKKSKKVVSARTVLQIESRKTRRLA